MARFVVSAAVGIVAGVATGNPGIGFQAFSLTYGVTGFLDPKQQYQGPRLDDLKVTSGAYGTPISYVEGMQRVAGSIAWASDKREIATTTDVGGKGGPSAEQTTYTYEMDALYLLTINECAGVRRIWANGELIWTIDAGATEDSITASDTTDKWRRITLYSGAADQLPDPTYEAAVGAGNAPAYRGRLTVFIEGLQLFSGGQLPVLTFEVVSEGVYEEGSDVTFNPSDKDPVVTLSNGNLTATNPTDTYGAVRANVGKTDGNWYWEFTVDVLDVSTDCWLGASGAIDGLSNVIGSYNPRAMLRTTGEISSLSLNTTLSGFSYGVGDVVGVAIKVATGETWFHINGVYYAFGNPSTGAAPTCNAGTPDPGDSIKPWFGADNSPGDTTVTANFGPTFAYPVPSGFSALAGLPATITPTPVYLDDVLTRLAERTGLLSASQLDVSDLSAIEVRGMAVSQVTPTRTVMQNLLSAYLVEAVESEGKIKYVLRGGASAQTIDFEDLGATSGEPVEPLPIRRLNDIELPAFVTVKFANFLNDYQDGSESGDRLITSSTAVSVTEVPLALTPGEAKRLADVATMDIATSILTVGPVTLTREFAALEPTDVITLTGPTGSTFRVRIIKITDAQGLRTLECVLDDATVINSEAATDDSYTSSTVVRALALTDLVLLGIPALRDADLGSGFYAAAAPLTADRWPGATFNKSLEDAQFERVGDFTQRSVIGYATTELGDWNGRYLIDEVGTVTVSVSGELSSITEASFQLDSTQNAFAIGQDGRWEILSALTCTLVSPGIYTLSRLLRGRRGTEWAAGLHEAGDRVVLLNSSLRRFETPVTDIGLDRFWRAITFGKALSSTSSEVFSDDGVGLEPFAPIRLEATRDGSDNITFTWTRRDRAAIRYGGPGGTYAPMSEATEAYSIDILDGVDVIRTITATSETATYSAADQTSDGLTPGDPVTAVVYQLSAVVGRGYPLEATV